MAWGYDRLPRTPGPEQDSGSECDKDEEVAGEEDGPLAELAAGIAAAPTQRNDFSFGGPADFLPSHPGLLIEGVGRVSLPLTDKAKADEIIAACEQSPFGKGLDTVVDTKVRNSFQLGPEKVKIENREWQKGLKKHTAAIAEKLGVPGVPITLHLYKLLLYKEGGHFAKHRDTEKEDGMFATMVVQLPSEHEGGELAVYCNDGSSRRVHDFGRKEGSAAYKCHYAVHYADAEHAITPITKGYRLALVYSICWPKASATPAPVNGVPETTRDELAQSLAELAEEARPFHYFFEHAYTAKSMGALGSAALKGQDRSRMAILQAANTACDPKHQYHFFIGKAERHVAYYDDSGAQCHKEAEWRTDEDPDVLVHSVLTLKGQMLTTRLKTALDDDDILNPDGKSVAQVWHGQRTTVYEGYLGNEGPTKDTTYHKFVLLAFPRTADFFEHLGGSAAFRLLTEAQPSADEIEVFLKRFISTKAELGGIGRRMNRDEQGSEENMRQKLVEIILKQPKPITLFNYYLQLYPGLSLLGPPAAWPTEDGLKDLLAIMNTEALWAEAAIRNAIVEGLGVNENWTLAVVNRCIQGKVDSALWADFMRVFEKLQAQKLSSSQLADTSFQHALWSVAIGCPLVRGKVIDRYLDAPPESLRTSVQLLTASCVKNPALLQEGTGALRPLFNKRLEWIESTLVYCAEMVRREHGWCFPRASRPEDRKLEAFLRGPNLEMTVHGFRNLNHARSAADRHESPHGQGECSYQARAGGRGHTSYVVLTKTDKYFAQCAAEEKVLQAELSGLRKVMGLDNDSSAAIVDGKENERPAKKARVE